MDSVTPDQLSNDSSYVSAPTSPGRLSMDTLCFYSVPATPARNSFKATTTPPKASYEDYANANSGFIDFEFETSRRFNLDDYDVKTCQNFESSTSPCQEQQEKESLPSMAYADELFCDGKVMPLKPPPRLQYGKYQSHSALTSPRSPTGLLKLPFQRRSLWNDDFDPFTVALENVKQEKNGVKTHRRARSMSPLRRINPHKPYTDTHSLSFSHKHIEIKQSATNSDGLMELNGSTSALYSIWVPDQNGKVGHQEAEQQVQKRPIRLAEPKGVLFARRARLVKTGHQKPSMRKVQGATEAEEGEGSFTTETKRQKIKKFLLKSASIRITSNVEKQKENESEALHKKSFSTKFSFKSKGLAQYNDEKRVSRVTKMTLMHYRPKLFLCMGYGTKYVS